MIEQITVGRSEQAEITDFDETIREDVLEKTTDKLFGRDGREFELISRRILVRESNLAILKGEDAVVRDGNAKDVGSKIFESCFSGAYGLAVNDPIFEPDLLVGQVEEVGLFELITELGTEES